MLIEIEMEKSKNKQLAIDCFTKSLKELRNVIEGSKNKQLAIDCLTKSLKELRKITDKLELDLYNTDVAIQHPAIYISGHFLRRAYEFFEDHIQTKANYNNIKIIYPELKDPNNKQDLIDFLKKSFEELKNITDIFEIDLRNKDETIHFLAIYLLGQFLLNAYGLFAYYNRHIDKNCSESPKNNKEEEKC